MFMFSLPVSRQIEIARTIFPDLEDLGNGICQATCPGASAHTTQSGKRDFRLWFEEGKGPHDHCMHRSCVAARDEAMRQLWQALAKAEGRGNGHAVATRPVLPAKPGTRPAPNEPFNADLAAEIAALNPFSSIDDEWLLAHSPVRIPQEPSQWSRLLLDTLYRPGEKILIFTQFASQGQFLYTVGGENVRLEAYPPRPGFLPAPRPKSPFPRGGQNGCWFLCAPVTGEWMPNHNNRDTHGAKLGRRHAACATRFPFLVLESDECSPGIWLRILTQLQDRICAVYTSGGKSYHALVAVNCKTKEEFDLARRDYITRLSALGADPAAITAVRLTRLPGCLRFGTGDGANHKPYLDPQGDPAPRMQKLLFLSPHAVSAAEPSSIVSLA